MPNTRYILAVMDSDGFKTGAVASPSDSRIPLLERQQVPTEIAAIYDKLLEDRGVVPNMFKALAHVPDLAMGITAFLKPLMAEGALPGWYKELIATRVASLNRCEYCVSAHRLLAEKRGATFGQVASYDNFENGPFTEKEKVGFRFATLLHASGHAVNEAAFEAVREYFTVPEIMELTAVAAAFEMFSRINSSLRIPVTQIPREDA
ncbi:MAG TPA: carboxymuconolactone decarboxylase family protein [Terracidiphilus sp.]|nr:carboxymuconolactone decarboxylase family protein [Terracidiphilus sp.]